MKGIYKFECDYGRSGTLSGIFIATPQDIEQIHSKTIYLGECLGKHSEVYFEPGDLRDHISLVTTDENALTVFSKHSLYSGYDLTDYLYEEE